MAEKEKPKKRKRQPGPEAERLKIEGDWEEAVRRVLKVQPDKKQDGG